MLEQRRMSFVDILDVLYGAFDAHWTRRILMQTENKVITFSFGVQRRTLQILGMIVCCYVLTYGLFRVTGLLIHNTQNRFTPLSQHSIISRTFTPLEIFYAPLGAGESLVWPLIDSLTTG